MMPVRYPSASFWAGKRVGITGHQGFKGAWLCMLLSRLGAQSFGYGHDDRTPLLYNDLSIPEHSSRIGDINQLDDVRQWLDDTKPDLLLHLAAQPIVLASYTDPMGTFSDNIMGTAHVLQAARECASLKAIVVVTSDKVYANSDSGKAFTEEAALGGDDPYSASKAAAEIVTRAMARSFYQGQDAPHVQSVRAGNVIGGGDWAEARLLPDAARAYAHDTALEIRNPSAVRPWQHVLDPLCGYLVLCEALWSSQTTTFGAWNFGPDDADARSVENIVNRFTHVWGGGARWGKGAADPAQKEAHLLSVSSDKARKALKWHPRWGVDEAVDRTAQWYRSAADGIAPQTLVMKDIDAFLDLDHAA